MNLRYISLTLSNDIEPDTVACYIFKCHVRFICNFMSKAVRKYKYETDGTYNMISIVAGESRVPYQGCNDYIEVYVPFAPVRYEAVKGTDDVGYYLELLSEGFKIASQFKDIPMSLFENILEDFETAGYKNCYKIKSHLFRGLNIKAMIEGLFTTNDFSLYFSAYSISPKRLLCEGIVARSQPDEIIFQHCFKDITVDEEWLYIMDFIPKALIRIRIADLKNGNLYYEPAECPYQQKNLQEAFSRTINNISYSGTNLEKDIRKEEDQSQGQVIDHGV